MKHLIAVMAVGIGLSLAIGAPAQTTDEAELVALTREAIEAQNDVLVTGNVAAALEGRERADRFRDGIQDRVQRMLTRRRALSPKGNDYKSHRTDVRVTETRIAGDRATVAVTEHVVLGLDPAGGRPAETEYVELHVMEYVRDGGQWRLVRDVVPPVPPLDEEIRAPAGVQPTVEAPPGHAPDPQMERRRGSARGDGTGSVFQFASLSGTRRHAVAYNYNAAVNYALTYWGPYESNYNSSYRVYSANDCTNFTSQVLRAGGWQFVDGDRTLSSSWYYGSFTWTTSYSWAGAHNFNQFFQQSGRGWAAKYFSDMYLGDILQADWGPTPDGNISHSMVVTAKASDGTIYLTYHSNNTRNRSIDDLRASNPGTNWYGLLMYW
jgi:hypothetical protein